MRHAEALCDRCVYRAAREDRPSRPRSTPDVRGIVAERERACSRCGAAIAAGQRYVLLLRNVPPPGGYLLPTVLGLVMMLSPLTLWLAWSQTVFFAVLGTTVASAAGLIVLRWLEGDDPDMPVSHPWRPPNALDDKVLDELGELEPWLHHNRRGNDAEFRARMARLRALLKLD